VPVGVIMLAEGTAKDALGTRTVLKRDTSYNIFLVKVQTSLSSCPAASADLPAISKPSILTLKLHTV
jgi:hypothetical protein